MEYRRVQLPTAISLIWVANTNNFVDRLLGVQGGKLFAWAHALRIAPCWAIHTIGMRRPIDVAFVSADRCIQRLLLNVPPGRAVHCWRAREVWEFSPGIAQRLRLRVGQTLPWP